MINLDLAFVIQLINFLVLVLVLNVFLFKPIRKVLSERQGEISAAKLRAEGVDRDVQDKMAQYEAKLREVKAKASDERSALIKEAQVEETSIVDKARKEATDSLASIKSRVAKEAAEARTLLQEQSRLLSVEICEKVLGRSL